MEVNPTYVTYLILGIVVVLNIMLVSLIVKNASKNVKAAQANQAIAKRSVALKESTLSSHLELLVENVVALKAIAIERDFFDVLAGDILHFEAVSSHARVYTGSKKVNAHTELELIHSVIVRRFLKEVR